MRYPTNVKLLWECAEWSYNQMKLTCKYLKIKLPRCKYEEQKDKYNNYNRKPKKNNKETIKRTRSLLYLLEKLLGLLNQIEEQHQETLEFPKRYYTKLGIIQKVFAQKQKIFETKKSVPDRIVSISKSYIRAIVRGKEIKAVEGSKSKYDTDQRSIK